MEPGLIEHCGAIAGDGCTEQDRVAEPLNPEIAARFTVAMEDPPGLTVLGASRSADSEKSGMAAVISNTVPKVEAPPALVVP